MKAAILQQEDEFLYNQVADKLEKNIVDGVLKIGDKLLSVRSLSREQGISLSTSFKAYTQLEIKGLIEARPKSGYYVSYSKRNNRPVAPVEMPEKEPADVSVDDMLARVYSNINATGVTQLSMATPALQLLPESKLNKTMAEVIREDPFSCMQYENIQGNIRLRKQVARYAFNWGGTITENDVVTTQGCMEALVFCLKAVSEPGDTIAIESPTFFGIFNAMKSLGLKVVEIPTDPITGISLTYLEEAIEKVNIKACLFVTNFTNPLGCSIPDDKKKKLVNMLAKRNIPLIEDDIYGELYFGKLRPRTCKSFDKKGLVLLCSSVSKSLAPGYRVGWCLPGKFTQKIINIKLMHTISAATPTQAAIGRFFETGRFDLHMRNLRKALQTQSLQYIQAILEHFPEDTNVSHPEGGYVLWVEMNKRVNAFDVFNAAMENRISIFPGQVFSTDARFTNYIRISFGNPMTKEINQSIKVLGRLVKELVNG